MSSSTRIATAARGADELPTGEVSVSDKIKNEVFNIRVRGRGKINDYYIQG